MARVRHSCNLDELFQTVYSTKGAAAGALDELTPPENTNSAHKPSLKQWKQIRDSCGRSLIHAAVKNCEVENLSAFIEAGCDLNIVDNDGCTPLHLAVVCGDTEILQELLKGKPNLRLSNSEGKSALAVALADNYYEASQMILESGCDINKMPGSPTLLLQAMLMGNYKHTRLYLKHGAHMYVEETDTTIMCSPMALVMKKKDDGALKLLLENGIDPNKKMKQTPSVPLSNCSPLMAAVMAGHLPLVELLLDSGAEMNTVEVQTCWRGYCCTPVCLAALCTAVSTRDKYTILGTLLLYNCDLNWAADAHLYSSWCSVYADKQNLQHCSPLFPLLKGSRIEAIKILILLGCNWRNEQEKTKTLLSRRMYEHPDLATLLENTFSLQVICRNQLRKSLGQGLKNKVDKLQLPVRLKEFILCTELLNSSFS